MRTDTANHFDAVVIGGSYAGLSAALQLARARRRILVVDAGVRRNRFVQSSHGFLGQDGRAPDAIAADGRAQLLAYPTVQWHAGLATQAGAQGDGFVVTLDTGGVVHAKRLVLAPGVVDELPAIDGLAERWGRTVFHCPYCHGYELNEGRIGVIASGAPSMHHAVMLPDWGRVTLFTHGTFVPDDAQRAVLSARGVVVEPEVIARIADDATVVLADGRQLPMDGLFTATRTRVASPLAAQLGCAFDDGPMGAFIRTDEMKQTTVPGVFACGDAARGAGNVALAVGDGALAGVGAHRSTIFDH
ncbi:MAG: NAD(P)/FAD-dependent oxidoreductase [Pseudomonadota bacterium]